VFGNDSPQKADQEYGAGVRRFSGSAGSLSPGHQQTSRPLDMAAEFYGKLDNYMI